MNVLLAPNGKPSNLTPEQYKLVRTPAFKEWFGDWENSPETASKVVDENGEPLVVWRGESKEFNKFDYKKLGSKLKTAWRKAGFYFSPTKSGAEQYMFFMQSGILKQFFLNIKNPYTFDSKEFFGVMDWGSLPTQRFKTNKSATDYANSQVEIIKNDNYDGFFVTILENDNVVEIVAFEPEQIKLADGTNTTFDSNNPDIRFDEGGNLEKNKNMENTNKNMENNFAKGGKILGKETEQGFVHNEQQKYARIGVSDIYYIEAYNTMGLQGVNFDETSLNEKLKTSLNILYNNYESYLISEDSFGIDIEFDVLINNAIAEGLPVENIEQLRNDKINPQKRQEKINEIAFYQKIQVQNSIE